MVLPPIYKYLDVQGAKLTLGNRTFKYAKPSDFNDTEDLTIQSIFPEETEVALKKMANGFLDVILQHLNDPPTCNSPNREKVMLMQQTFRTDPSAADFIKAEIAREEGKPDFDVERQRARCEAFVTEINSHMQDYRVLCVTTHRDSEKMWSGYAEDHKGIALRIEPNLDKDSNFRLFRPVVYREKRPPLYDDPLEMVAGGLFGDKETRTKAMIEKIVYAKTLKWEHESEYRLPIPFLPNDQPWNTLLYHPEEITELYLGFAMEQADMDEIVGLAQTVNPEVIIFRAKRDADEKLGFERV
ncbi:MAG: DUF2971 domain-containing protein [Parvibaculum sp.]